MEIKKESKKTTESIEKSKLNKVKTKESLDELTDVFNKIKEKTVNEFNKNKARLLEELDFNDNKDTEVNNISKQNTSNIKDNIKKDTKDFNEDKKKKESKTFIEFIRKHKGIVIGVFIIILLVLGVLIANNRDNNFINNGHYYDTGNKEEVIIKKYKVKVHIDFEENIILSKYDVILSTSLNEKKLSHGKNTDAEFILDEGTHTLCFTNADNSNIKNEVTISVDSNMEVGYKITCHYDNISVEELYIDKDKELEENEIKMVCDNSKYKNTNYSETIKELKTLGFKNIREEPIYDIDGDFFDADEGAVEMVKINGSDSYKRGEIFKNNVEVIISYHLKVSDDPSKIKPPFDSASSEGKKYEEIVKAFQDAGFTNVIAEPFEISDIWEEEEKNGTVQYIYINSKGLDNTNSAFNSNDEVKIRYYVIKESGPSNTELGYGFAKNAFEKYGESKYKYGFKCHWIVDLLSSEHRDDGSWYFKVGVTITNMYGAEYDTVAEGIVSGSDANPKVTQFYVSNNQY